MTKNPTSAKISILGLATLVGFLTLLTGCTPDQETSDAASPMRSASERPRPSGSVPSASASSRAVPTNPGVSDQPATSASPSDAAEKSGQQSCILFGKTFEQKIDVKISNQEKALSLARQAAQQNPKWGVVADDMAVIASVGKRINIEHDATVTPDESNAAGQAVVDLQQKCTAAGSGFELPAD